MVKEWGAHIRMAERPHGHANDSSHVKDLANTEEGVGEPASLPIGVNNIRGADPRIPQLRVERPNRLQRFPLPLQS
jgi:hypothetical protein